ncbi:hypothetical protein BU14_1330s0004, partial [Porphyra umbilicalis]
MVKGVRRLDGAASCRFSVKLDKREVTVTAESPQDADRWMVALEKAATASFPTFYKKQKTIGRGHFSTVILAVDRQTSERVAVKIIKRDKSDVTKTRKYIRREVKVLSTTSHPNIIGAVDFFSHDGKPHLVMQYVPGGSLRDALRKKGHFSEPDARLVLRGILRGLEYLHVNRIIHRDVKPENVLLATPTHPLITDFGLATFTSSRVPLLRTIVGTPAYVAPELLRGERYGPAVDVWAAGIVLYFLLAGERPFGGKSREDIRHAVLTGSLEFPDKVWGGISPGVKGLVVGMLQRDQNVRLTASQALRHPWMAADGGGGADVAVGGGGPHSRRGGGKSSSSGGG